MAEIPTYALNDGNALPAIGFGTYPLRGEDGTAAIASALECGYRLIDTGKDGPGINGGVVQRRGPEPAGYEPVTSFVCTVARNTGLSPERCCRM